MAKKKTTDPGSSIVKNHSNKFMMGRNNYLIMLVGLILLAIGFALMAGGGTDDPSIFPKEEIYSFRRISLSVIVIMIGFGIQIFAIMRKPKSEGF
ncbi:MAG: DUF3098 domain-containing protein [Chitinophagales bacterium]|nr:DUF3098 domain-containing protein [Chitinophagales bacterium]